MREKYFGFFKLKDINVRDVNIVVIFYIFLCDFWEFYRLSNVLFLNVNLL